MDPNQIIFRNQPCPAPGCGSSDALQVYADLHAHCFSCNTHFKRVGADLERAEVPRDDVRFQRAEPRRASGSDVAAVMNHPMRGFKERGIGRNVCEFFGVRAKMDENDEYTTDHYYPYQMGTAGIPKAFKHRTVKTKKFEWIGKAGGLFGRGSFNGDGRRIVICEGEVDALSVAHMWFRVHKKIYPVVALSSSTATKELIPERAWLRTFDEIVLAFDMDESGEKATKEAIRILGGDRIKVVRFAKNDANAVLVEEGYRELYKNILDAEKYVPAGIVTGTKVWDAMVDLNRAPSHPYPECLRGLNAKLKGKRKGQITLFTSGTGAGKTTMTKEIMLDVLATTTSKVGLISLEESPAEAGVIFSAMAISKNNAEEDLSDEELREGWNIVFAEERLLLLDHAGAITDDSILDSMAYMALSGCEYLILDHITILVSEGAEGLTGNEATDKVMNNLLKFVKEYNIWLGVISHLRKTQGGSESFEDGKLPTIDDIRGSGSIKQISWDIVAFARNLVAADDDERNTIKIRVLKCRKTGLTGDVPGCRYNYETGRLEYLENEDMPEDDYEVVQPVAKKALPSPTPATEPTVPQVRKILLGKLEGLTQTSPPVTTTEEFIVEREDPEKPASKEAPEPRVERAQSVEPARLEAPQSPSGPPPGVHQKPKLPGAIPLPPSPRK